MTIPDGIFDAFNQGVTDMLSSQMAPTCILVYPSQKLECPNCIVSPFGGSSGQYKSGGPISFVSGQVCPYCQGAGIIETASTDTLKLLIDWNPKSMKSPLKRQNVGNDTPLYSAEDVIQVQGYITDLQKFRQSIQVRIQSDLANYDYWVFEKEGEPIPYGLSHNSFFSCMLKRVGQWKLN